MTTSREGAAKSCLSELLFSRCALTPPTCTSPSAEGKQVHKTQVSMTGKPLIHWSFWVPCKPMCSNMPVYLRLKYEGPRSGCKHERQKRHLMKLPAPVPSLFISQGAEDLERLKRIKGESPKRIQPQKQRSRETSRLKIIIVGLINASVRLRYYFV